MAPIAYEAATDPLCRDVPLRHRTRIPVLGIPVDFLSNAAAIIEAAETSFGGWKVLNRAPALVEAEPVTIRLIVHAGDEGPADHAPLRHRVLSDHRILFGSPGSMGYADPGRRESVAFVTPRLVADREHFRYSLLEALTLATLTPLDRQPLHAAALVRDGAAVVMAGPSGVGKSTLAYVAARHGFGVLAEDTVHLQSVPRLRLWGLPGYLHIRADAAERFPELRDRHPRLLANGREKIAVDARRLGSLPPRPVVERGVFCLLAREGGPARLDPLDPDHVLQHLLDNLEPGFDLFADTLSEPLSRLLQGGAWRLHLSSEPAEALPLIERLLAL